MRLIFTRDQMTQKLTARDNLNPKLSLALYRYLCRDIVGTEGHVNQMRYMTAVRDNIASQNGRTYITSGSFGEGLEMRGSDLDTVFVLHELFEVCEELKPGFSSKITHFLMEIDDVKPSYSLLRLYNTESIIVRDKCEKHNGKQYYSSALHKQGFLLGINGIMHKQGFVFGTNTIHGPCISDDGGLFDGAISFRCKTWVSSAIQWITRSRNAWPSHDVKHSIIKHGVLFVPIGVKGSPTEDLEWRISFSVGEKFLINTFTHTQLLCYALLKILLKDVIATFPDCKDLLCSYFLKTIMFWISEELPQSAWKPVNTIPCFMRCFSRLIYCVEYSVCLHYFIPENNMFENKIEGISRVKLLEKLYTLYSYGWRCILFSDQMYNFQFSMSNFHVTQHTSSLFGHGVMKLLTSSMLFISHLYFKNRTINMKSIFKNGVFQTVICQQSSIKDMYLYYMSMCSSALAQITSPNSSISVNKSKYKQYKFCLRNVYHDAVSGWLMVASFLYKTKQYSETLQIIEYSLSKCTPDKLCHHMIISEEQLLQLNSFQKKNYVYLEKMMLAEDICFMRSSSITPDELQMVDSISNDLCWFPSIAYAYFLEFLCHYHHNNVRLCQVSFQSLKLVITEEYLISQSRFKNESDTLLGIASQLLSRIETD